MIHRPRFSSGASSGNTALGPLWQDLYDYGVELLLSGHDHDYERFAPMNATGGLDAAHGVVQMVVGNGGVNETGATTVKANSLVRDFTTFGVLKLTLHATSYDWELLPVAGATFTDSGSQAVHDGTNTAPVVDTRHDQPGERDHRPRLLTATVTSHDADGDTLTTAYQWTKNGTDIAGATGADAQPRDRRQRRPRRRHPGPGHRQRRHRHQQPPHQQPAHHRQRRARPPPSASARRAPPETARSPRPRPSD